MLSVILVQVALTVDGGKGQPLTCSCPRQGWSEDVRRSIGSTQTRSLSPLLTSHQRVQKYRASPPSSPPLPPTPNSSHRSRLYSVMAHPATSVSSQSGKSHIEAKESRLHDRLDKIDKAAAAVLDNYVKLFEHAKVGGSRMF